MPITQHAAFPKQAALPRELEFTLAAPGAPSCSIKVAQGLRALGYDDKEMARALDAVRLLKEAAGRDINPVLFARLRESYRMRWSAMAALASMCRQDAADLGLVFRSLVRFYKRSHMKESDLDEMERFVEWIISRGETIRGVNSAWKEYKRLR